MQAGVIASVESEGPINGYRGRVQFDNHPRFDQLEQCIEIRQKLEIDNGRVAQIGRAAIEDVRERDIVHISDDGKISQREKEEKYTRYTEFLHVPESFIAVSKSSGSFLFSLLNDKTPHQVIPVDIELDTFVDEHLEALIWKIGFHERGSNVENGVVHGNDLLQDAEVGDILGASEKNQAGLEYNFNGESVKMFVTESGYIEIYQPSNYDARDFIRFIENEILHLVRER